MPSTYLWSDLITLVKPWVQGIPTGTIDAIVCDQLNSAIWRAAFWRWSISTLTPIALLDGIQDYAIANADFFRLFRVRLTRTDVTPNADDEKDILESLSPSKN